MMITKQDAFLEHADQDVLLAFGDATQRLWINYRTLIERLTAEVESGKYASVTPMEVGCLHRIVPAFEFPGALPLEFEGVLKRLTIDKDYHGHAMVGMGDLLAIRSIEEVIPARVDEALYARLVQRPLLVGMLKELRQSGQGRGIASDLQTVASMARHCLTLLCGMAAVKGNVTADDIKTLHDVNGLDQAPRLEAPDRHADFFAVILEDEGGR